MSAWASAGENRPRNSRRLAAVVAAGLVALTPTAIARPQPDDGDGYCQPSSTEPSWPPGGATSWPPDDSASWPPTCVPTSTSPTPTPTVPPRGQPCPPDAYCPAR